LSYLRPSFQIELGKRGSVSVGEVRQRRAQIDKIGKWGKKPSQIGPGRAEAG
jgi:hypothetical protein